jgi:hypothetical protein
MTQRELDDLFDKVLAGDKNALAFLRQMRDTGKIHIPPGAMRPVLGPAPAAPVPEPVVERPAGPAGKKELTEAQRAEMLASEERMRQAALAQQEAETQELRRIQAEREAQLAAVAAAPKAPAAPEKPKAPKGKTAAKKDLAEPTTPPKPAAPGPSFVRAPEPERTEPSKPREPETPAPRPPTPEKDAARERLRQAGKEETKARANATATVELLKPPADAVEGLRRQNFKQEWGQTKIEVRNRILRTTFGEGALKLSPSAQSKLGEIALAEEAFKNSGATSLPDMDDALSSVTRLKDRISTMGAGDVSSDVKGIEQAIGISHERVLTKGSGKIRGDLLKFRKPRAGEIGSEMIGETPVARERRLPQVTERSPGFEKAKAVEVPENMRNARGKKSVDDEDFGQPEAPAAAAPAPATAPAPAPAATPAAAAAAAPTGKKGKELSPYMQIVLADEATYGKQSDRQGRTKEQRAARKALAEKLGINTPDARAAKKAAAIAADPDKAEVNRLWGEAVRANPTKYGKSARRRSKEQKKAANDLYAKIEADYKAGIYPKAAPAAAAAATAAAAPAPTAAAPAAPAPAPAPVPAPTAAPAAPAVSGGGAPPVPPTPPAPPAGGPAPGGKGRRFTNKQIRQRAAQIFKNKGLKAAGSKALGFLGPLAAMYTAYELLGMLKSGTVDAADERRLKALESLGAVGQGMGQDLAMKSQIRDMQRMIDMSAIQRQQANDQMSRRYIEDDALNSLLAGQQASLSALAQPSRPSIAEMMARM